MSQAADACAYALAQVGKPYKWDTAGPDTFDCSGLILAAYAAAHPPVTLIHYTGAQLLQGIPVLRSQLEPGDICFPDTGHVVMYLGNNQVVEAPHDGANVQVVPFYGMAAGARRVTTDGLSGNDFSMNGNTASAQLTGVQTNPLSDLNSASANLAQFGKVATHILDPQFWRRIGEGMIAVALIIIGIVIFFRRPIGTAVGVAVKPVAALAKEATLTRVRVRTGIRTEQKVHQQDYIRSMTGVPSRGSPKPPPSAGYRPFVPEPGRKPQHRETFVNPETGRTKESEFEKGTPRQTGRHRVDEGF